MDHGAWPFFVDGVTCLVKEKKMREDEREKKTEEMKEKRRDIEMKRKEGKFDFFKKKKMFQNPQTRQMN